MITTPRSPFRSRRFVQCSATLLLVALYPMLSMLWHQGYPLFSAEFMLIAATLGMLSLLLAMLLYPCRPLVVNAVLIAAVTISLTLQFNLLLEGLLLTLAAITLIAALARERMTAIVLPVFLALIAGAFLDSWSDRRANQAVAVSPQVNQALPAVLHIVADGLFGIDGLPPQQPAQAFRQELLDFLRRYGFAVNSRAYSRYYATEDSLARALNFRHDPENLFQRSHLLHQGLKVRENAYLDALANHGYRLRIYQSEAMDLCHSVTAAVDRCWTYVNPNARSLRSGVDSAMTRSVLLTKMLIARSQLLDDIVRKLGLETTWGVSTHDPAIYDALAADLADGARGQVFFAHLMMPHPPYVFDADCNTDYSSASALRFSASAGDPANSYDTRGIRYLMLLDQTRCLLRELGGLFERMQKADVFDQTTIVLHGDHGSRIYLNTPRTKNAERLTITDLRDGYATLFAIKQAGGQFMLTDQVLALDALLERTAMQLTGKDYAEPEQKPFIYLGGSFPLYRLEVDIFGDEMPANGGL